MGAENGMVWFTYIKSMGSENGMVWFTYMKSMDEENGMVWFTYLKSMDEENGMVWFTHIKSMEENATSRLTFIISSLFVCMMMFIAGFMELLPSIALITRLATSVGVHLPDLRSLRECQLMGRHQNGLSLGAQKT